MNAAKQQFLTSILKPGEHYAGLGDRILELEKQHGSLRAAARALGCDAGYLSRLRDGEKDNPSAILLKRMGLKRVVAYERIKSPTFELRVAALLQ